MSNYFPLLIVYTETQEQVIVNTPEEIRSGVTFRVLKTNC